MIKVRAESTNQIYTIDDIKDLNPGQEIFIEIDKVIEPAVVLCNGKCKKDDNLDKAKYIRILEEKDIKDKIELKEKAKEFINEARKKVFRHGLDMKILDAGLSSDEKKLTFYFTAEGRVDFRGLVSDMAGDFRKIIRLQQLGPREQAQVSGGFGKCGRVLCCSSFCSNLGKNDSTEKSANIKSPMYIGNCGKPMCCLSYENDNTNKEGE